jgi:hypothetical protein
MGISLLNYFYVLNTSRPLIPAMSGGLRSRFNFLADARTKQIEAAKAI